MMNVHHFTVLLGFILLATYYGKSGEATVSRFRGPPLDFNGGETPQRHHKLPISAFLTRYSSPEPLRPRRQTATCDDNELAQRLAPLQCDRDYLSAVGELEGVECSFHLAYRQITDRFSLTRHFQDCASDDKDILCVIHDTSEVSPYVVADDVIEQCLTNSTLNCTTECKTTLQSFSGTFGCCIHSLDIIQSSERIRALTPQLWEDCNVTLPAPCNNAPQALAPLNVNTSCSYTCTLTQFQAVFCKYQAAEAISILRECGRDQQVRLVSQLCGFNYKGDFCPSVGNINVFSFFLFPTNELDDEYVLAVYDKCISIFSTGICPFACREALLDAKERFGCCFNNINKTSLGVYLFPAEEGGVRDFLTNPALWGECVVETPGFCELPSDPQVYDELTQCSVCEISSPSSQSDGFPLGVIGALALVVIILMISVPILIYCYYRKRYNHYTSKQWYL